jgi:hypothetical protein
MDVNFLKDFLKQSQTNNLKTKGIYPDSILDLDIKVSFGMGTPTHVPWISFLGPGMSTSNGYYPVYLYYKKERVLVLAYGVSETVEFDDPWSKEIVEDSIKISELLDNPFRYGASFAFKNYQMDFDDKGVRFLANGKDIDSGVLSKDLEKIISDYKNCLEVTVKDESSALSKGLFYMEQQLEDFIIQNWDESEFGKLYDLIEEGGELKSQQYRTDIGPIDILAREKNTGNYVVIELKRNQTSDATVGQIARYMGWVEEHLSCDIVKGVIVCGTYDKKLDYARKRVRDVEVFLYEVNFSLKEYKK